MNKRHAARCIAAIVFCSPTMAQALPPADATVERVGPEQLRLRWSSADPVDILAVDRASAPIKAAKTIVQADRDGIEIIGGQGYQRRYFYLRNSRTGEVAKAAERVLPLEQGSNFRDLGGYTMNWVLPLNAVSCFSIPTKGSYKLPNKGEV